MNTITTIKSAIKFCIMLVGWMWALLCVCVSTIFTAFRIQSFDRSTTDDEHRTTLSGTCSHSLPLGMFRPVAIHWNVAFCPAFTSTSPRRRKWGALSAAKEQVEEISKFTDCGLHVNAEATEPEAVSYMDVIKNTQYTREDIYTHEEHVHYQLDFTEL